MPFPRPAPPSLPCSFASRACDVPSEGRGGSRRERRPATGLETFREAKWRRLESSDSPEVSRSRRLGSARNAKRNTEWTVTSHSFRSHRPFLREPFGPSVNRHRGTRDEPPRRSFKVSRPGRRRRFQAIGNSDRRRLLTRERAGLDARSEANVTRFN